MSALTVLNPRDLRVIEGEQKPRVLDLRIAEMLGLERPTNIRQVIKDNEARLSRRGGLHARNANPGPLGGRPATEYWLTEWQAIKVCMWSEAPNADEVQDLIADVFIAWRHGELLPKTESPSIIQAIGDLFDPVHKKLDHLTSVVERQDGNVSYIRQRVDDVVPRYDFSKDTQRTYNYTTNKRYEGKCNCGCWRRIMDKLGNRIRDDKGEFISEYDHWYSRERNGRADGWLVHKDCHQKLTTDSEYRQTKIKDFEFFQRNVDFVTNKTISLDIENEQRQRAQTYCLEKAA